jgi:hypothetical protein
VSAFAKTQKPAKRHHRVGNLPAELLDHQSLYRADVLAGIVVDSRPFDPIAADQFCSGRERILCHVDDLGVQLIIK